MGGIGSGTWYRYKKKRRIENSITLSMQDFRRKIFLDSKGKFAWQWVTGNQFVVKYRVDWGEAPIIVLEHALRSGGILELPIHLKATKTNFGGQRWWFQCPLIVEGVPCERRVSKLHLPPGAQYFGCRHCHELTYQSSQTAHQTDRGTGTIEWAEHWVDTLLKRSGKHQRPPATQP